MNEANELENQAAQPTEEKPAGKKRGRKRLYKTEYERKKAWEKRARVRRLAAKRSAAVTLNVAKVQWTPDLLRKAMEECKVSQNKLARRVNCRQATISDWLTGKRKISKAYQHNLTYTFLYHFNYTPNFFGEKKEEENAVQEKESERLGEPRHGEDLLSGGEQ